MTPVDLTLTVAGAAIVAATFLWCARAVSVAFAKGAFPEWRHWLTIVLFVTMAALEYLDSYLSGGSQVSVPMDAIFPLAAGLVIAFGFGWGLQGLDLSDKNEEPYLWRHLLTVIAVWSLFGLMLI